MKFLATLLSLLDRLWAAWDSHKLRQQGRQESIKETNDAINAQVDLAEHAVATPDTERDKRLRARFDTASE